jgi:2-iminobutanoate/2-iminopropanoate deaminase
MDHSSLVDSRRRCLEAQGVGVMNARLRLRHAATWAAILLMSGCAGHGSAGPANEFYPMPGSRPLPFSEAVRVGDMLYLSGQLGTDSTGKLVPGGIGPETRQALTNIAAVLARHGSSMDRVVKCTVMLADMREWGAMNEVYVKLFPQHRPARSAFGTTGLALGARLELECLAR